MRKNRYIDRDTSIWTVHPSLESSRKFDITLQDIFRKNPSEITAEISIVDEISNTELGTTEVGLDSLVDSVSLAKNSWLFVDLVDDIAP